MIRITAAFLFLIAINPFTAQWKQDIGRHEATA
jgi:hypothetical protein